MPSIRKGGVNPHHVQPWPVFQAGFHPSYEQRIAVEDHRSRLFQLTPHVKIGETCKAGDTSNIRKFPCAVNVLKYSSGDKKSTVPAMQGLYFRVVGSAVFVLLAQDADEGAGVMLSWFSRAFGVPHTRGVSDDLSPIFEV